MDYWYSNILACVIVIVLKPSVDLSFWQREDILIREYFVIWPFDCPCLNNELSAEPGIQIPKLIQAGSSVPISLYLSKRKFWLTLLWTNRTVDCNTSWGYTFLPRIKRNSKVGKVTEKCSINAHRPPTFKHESIHILTHLRVLIFIKQFPRVIKPFALEECKQELYFNDISNTIYLTIEFTAWK